VLPGEGWRGRRGDVGSGVVIGAHAIWRAALFSPALAKEVLVWRFAVPR
jgi:hypothetical protein